MTKKKALMYFIIFIVMTSATALLNKFYLTNPADKFNDACKMVINTSCQYYLTTISAEGKFEEAVEIQKVRINENIRILKFFKNKTKNKCLFEMSTDEAGKELIACMGIPAKAQNARNDYFLLGTIDFTIKDIVTDSVAVAAIQRDEFKNPEDALKTLKKARKIVEKNKFFSLQKEALNLLDGEIKTTVSAIK